MSTLNEDEWNPSPMELSKELGLFIEEFETFTPEHFAQVNFHLLRRAGLTKSSRNELCRVSIKNKHCINCEFLYVAKKCLLWSRLYKIIDWGIVERSPPCIRLAFAKKTIKTVANYLVQVNLISPPFYKVRGALSCNLMRRWGYCVPNEYCRAMKTNNVLEYIPARERVKLSREHN
ncbi:hypothetical protein EU527_07350 [Candidatus Thorarchaeota archaeon]|nr:MAG: hypothetical protein EU527_07350 [Candidatus Thorarchaeota archaeon]